uniref:Reverse transcriptase domain-containing protein n=1 Tax=Pyropia tenera TaxID=2785 RepID=R9R8Q1_PYRTE|nr:hypothetical protein M491_mgp29 [Neopyropia tenera]AGL96412.1 hypothetical protein [Neopyropia tenera]
MQWNNIMWKHKEIWLYHLQRKIFDLSKLSDMNAVFFIQKQIIKHENAKFLAVRKVTQDNLGKRTAGVDGISSLTPDERMELVKNLHIDHRADKILRITIPKSNGSVRNLGIPTIRDRAKQCLVKFALEPQYEALFEPNSYGFRPGRSTNDARKAIVKCLQRKPKYVLDADIKGCFDNIDHSKLLEKLKTFPLLKLQIAAWLRAGILVNFKDNITEITPESGTPQGGIISPLLANIALHGMEKLVSKRGVYLIRYADDFLILCNEEKELTNAKLAIKTFLTSMGLELSKEKTRITYTGDTSYRSKKGIDFLGFSFVNYKVGIHKSAKDSHGNLTGWMSKCQPSKKSVKKHLDKVKNLIQKSSGLSQKVLISKLARVINGWTRYFAVCNATESFSFCSMRTFYFLTKWSKQKNRPGLGASKHWIQVGNAEWVFGVIGEDETIKLNRHDQTKIIVSTKVLNDSSPYDGRIIYWSKRLSSSNKYGLLLRTLLKIKGPKCKMCKIYFNDSDRIEIDHIVPRKQGGTSEWDNLRLLHGHCHDTRHSKDE